jgi:hypothetical protein
MLRSALARTAAVLAGSAVVIAGATLSAGAASTAAAGWRAVTTIGVKGREAVFTGVDAVSAGDAWAAGFAGTSGGKNPEALIEHWAGRSWQPARLPAKVAKAWNAAGPTYVVTGATSATNVWAVTEFPGRGNGSDEYLRLSGRTWSTGTLPGTSTAQGRLAFITAVVVLGKANVWAFGGTLASSGTAASFAPYVARYNGIRWSTVRAPGRGMITAAGAITAHNMWAVTGTAGIADGIPAGSSAAPSEVLHWNGGSSWQKAAAQPSLPAGADLTSIGISPGRQIWIGGDVPTSTGGTAVQFTDEFAGRTWAAPADLPHSGATAGGSGGVPYQIESLVPVAGGGEWALSDNFSGVAPKLWRYGAGQWTQVASPTLGSKHRALVQLSAVPGTASVWGVGELGSVSSSKALIALTGPTPR